MNASEFFQGPLDCTVSIWKLKLILTILQAISFQITLCPWI